MITAAIVTYMLVGMVALSVVGWVLGLVFRIFGWSMRLVFGSLRLLLWPLWLVAALFGGFALAVPALVPLALIWVVLSVLVPEE